MGGLLGGTAGINEQDRQIGLDQRPKERVFEDAILHFIYAGNEIAGVIFHTLDVTARGKCVHFFLLDDLDVN